MPWSLALRLWSVEFFGLNPFDAFVPCKLESQALGSNNQRFDINKNGSVDGFTSEIEIFVSLDEKGCHSLLTIDDY